MNKEVRRKLEMAARVREFSRTHASDDPAHALVLGRLEDRLSRVKAIADRQVAGRSAARTARAHREELRRVVQSQLLRYLVAVGSVAGKTRTELAEQYRLPSSRGPTQAFLASVRVLLAKAESQRDLLVSEGMSPTLLDTLGGLVSQLETAVEAARTGRLDHIGARADLDILAVQVSDLVRLLDGFNRVRFGQDPKLLAEWEAVRGAPGRSRREGPGGRPADGGSSPQPGDIAPAA
jgi:hypothetical protein